MRPSIIESMKRVLFILISLAILSPLDSQEIKTANNFGPPPSDEKALMDELPQSKNPAVGFWITTGTTAAGAVLSGVALGYTVKSAMDRDIPSLNQGILLTVPGPDVYSSVPFNCSTKTEISCVPRLSVCVSLKPGGNPRPLSLTCKWTFPTEVSVRVTSILPPFFSGNAYFIELVTSSLRRKYRLVDLSSFNSTVNRASFS